MTAAKYGLDLYDWYALNLRGTYDSDMEGYKIKGKVNTKKTSDESVKRHLDSVSF